jgi:hypothetical protein
MALTARVERAVGALAAEDWDRLAGPDNPFTSHAFLALLEESGSVGGRSGWTPLPLVIDDAAGRPAAALPAYLKQHSQGEYVFDQAWADAWQRAGGDYYPKLQISVPFTPASGPRLLCGDRPDLALPLLRAAEAVVDQNGLSSAHATFIAPEEVPVFEEAGWLLRRPAIPLGKSGLCRFRRFPGRAVIGQAQEPAQGTRGGAGRGGDRGPDRQRHPPGALGRVLGVLSGHRRAQVGAALSHPRRVRPDRQRMADKVLLVLALDEGEPVAGALNFIGATRSMAAIGARWSTSRSCISSCAITRRSMRPSPWACAAWKPARKGSTSWRAAMSRCRPGRRTISPTPDFARPWPISSSANAKASRRARWNWPGTPLRKG